MARPDIGSGDTAFACVRVQLKTPAKKEITPHQARRLVRLFLIGFPNTKSTHRCFKKKKNYCCVIRRDTDMD
jgi:hypothetical protein